MKLDKRRETASERAERIRVDAYSALDRMKNILCDEDRDKREEEEYIAWLMSTDPNHPIPKHVLQQMINNGIDFRISSIPLVVNKPYYYNDRL